MAEQLYLAILTLTQTNNRRGIHEEKKERKDKKKTANYSAST